MLLLPQGCIDVLFIPLSPYQKYPQRIFTISLLPRRVSFPQILVFRTQKSGLSKLNITALGNVPFLWFLENTKQSSDISRAILSHLDIKFCSMDLSKQCPPPEWDDIPGRKHNSMALRLSRHSRLKPWIICKELDIPLRMGMVWGGFKLCHGALW